MSTLAQVYDFNNLVVKKAFHSKYENENKLENPLFVVDSNALVGIEIEVENMKNDFTMPPYYWSKKEDNSLRNSGLEFVSIPLRCNQIEYALDFLNKWVNAFNTPIFSPRTSVHIHMNARDMTPDQIKAFVLLYTVFEKHFFHIAGTKRESSIFCVPFYKTVGYAKPSTLLDGGALNNWHKYTALNLGTLLGTNQLPRYGTIEFRHLYGTLDKITIINWINNIVKLRVAAMHMDYKQLQEQVRTMNTTSSYVQLYSEIFGEYAMLRKMEKYDFESCVTFAKRWEWGFELRNKYSITDINVWKQRVNGKPKEETLVQTTADKQEPVNINQQQVTFLDELSLNKIHIVDDLYNIKNVITGEEYPYVNTLQKLQHNAYKLIHLSTNFVIYENMVTGKRYAVKRYLHHTQYTDITSPHKRQRLIMLEKLFMDDVVNTTPQQVQVPKLPPVKKKKVVKKATPTHIPINPTDW